MSPALVAAVDEQARWCRALGSPFSADVLDRLTGEGAAWRALAGLLQPWGDADHAAIRADAAHKCAIAARPMRSPLSKAALRHI